MKNESNNNLKKLLWAVLIAAAAELAKQTIIVLTEKYKNGQNK